jgi:hypothetical protein
MANHGRKIASDITAEFASGDNSGVAVPPHIRERRQALEIKTLRADVLYLPQNLQAA